MVGRAERSKKLTTHLTELRNANPDVRSRNVISRRRNAHQHHHQGHHHQDDECNKEDEGGDEALLEDEDEVVEGELENRLQQQCNRCPQLTGSRRTGKDLALLLLTYSS